MSARAQNLQEWTDSYLRNLPHFRGVIAAQKNGELLIQSSHGFAVEDWQIPNTIDTNFELASVSKQFTAAAILQLAEAGKLRLDDPVGKYYTEAPPNWKQITIHHLLTHTSGIPHNDLGKLPEGLCRSYTTDELIKTFRDLPLVFQPGAQWAYRNTEYYLLAYIIERLAGESYGDYLTHHIFQPLGMTHSGFTSTLSIVPKMAEGYTPDGKALRHRDCFNRSLEVGAGGIYSNVADLLAWNHALDAPGFLNAHSLDLMFTAHPPGIYGYGWFVETQPRRKIYHEGGDPGFAAFELRYPDQRLVIIVLANEDDAPVRDIANTVAERVLGGAKSP
jgi:CubicO group peptidase (beta-lactamase class C family)